MKIIHSTLHLTLILVISTLSHATVTVKPWTFLVYIAGDNSLSDFVNLDLNEMQKVGSNDNINVLACVSSHLPKATTKYVVHPGNLEKISSKPNVDSGDINTLIDALAWAHTNYPSQHFALILWDHGSGPLNRNALHLPWRGVCWDDTTGNYFNDLDLYYAFDLIIKNYRNGAKFDIVGFDACLMASLEIGFTLQPFVNYMVASEETIPGYGWDYKGVLSPMQQQALNPDAFAVQMVDAYGKSYLGNQDYTLSALNLNKLSPLVTLNNQIADFFTKQLSGSNAKNVKKILAQAVAATTHFEENSYFDLYQLYSNLMSRMSSMKLSSKDAATLKSLLQNAQNSLSSCVMKQTHSVDFPKVNGISIYIPVGRYLEPSYAQLYWSKQTKWLSFIKLYAK